MATFLATWNPNLDRSLDTQWEAIGEQIAAHGSAHGRRSMGNRVAGVTPGDTVLLVRQGRDRGIVAAGRATSAVFRERHWDDARATAGEDANFVDIDWHEWLPIDRRLPIETLLGEVPEVSWNSLFSSGVRVAARAEAKLSALWTRHVSSSTGGPVATARRTPDWTWEEQVLALDLYLRCGAVSSSHPDVRELSALLNRLPIHPVENRLPTFRNPNGVARKLAVIRANQPGYVGSVTNTSALDVAAWERYFDDLAAVHEHAAAIRARAWITTTPEPDEDEFEQTHQEGRLIYRLHRTRERDPRLRQRKISQVKQRLGGLLACEACDRVLSEGYGEVGNLVFECHHVRPLHITGEILSTVDDVALLCPTCHRVAHRITPWPSLSELREVASGRVS